MDLYAENILEHYRNPRGKQEVRSKKQEVRSKKQEVTHSESNPACGDEITVGLTIHDDYIQNIHWDGTGCAISQAAMSMLSETLSGKSHEDVAALTKENVLTLLGVPIGPRRLKCALLGLHTLKNAIQKAQGNMVKGWAESVL